MHKLSPTLARDLAPTLAQGIPRFHTTEGYYHVVLSGNRRKVLFSTVDDRRALNAIAFDVLQRFDATLHAYCLMPNHFRALVQIDDRHLTKALRRIATHYSQHRQRHLKSDLKPGPHLFERPYTAQRVDTDGDFLSLLRHIHLTPVIANKVVAPDDYLWSSHRAYLGYKSVARITTDFGLSLLAASPAQARVAYHQFIADGLAEDVARSAGHKPQVANNTSHSSENSTCDGPSVATKVTPANSSLTDSQTPLPRKIKPALPQFDRKRRHLLARRFVSVY